MAYNKLTALAYRLSGRRKAADLRSGASKRRRYSVRGRGRIIGRLVIRRAK